MLITKHEIIENKISGDFSRELVQFETREVREAYVACQDSHLNILSILSKTDANHELK